MDYRRGGVAGQQCFAFYFTIASINGEKLPGVNIVPPFGTYQFKSVTSIPKNIGMSMILVRLFLLILINMVSASSVLADCSWKTNIGLPSQISQTDELVRANGTVLLDCGADNVTFSLNLTSPAANNGGFTTNLTGITVKYQVNTSPINQVEREFSSGQTYPLEVLIEQKEGNDQGGQLQLPPFRVCYTEPNAAGPQCREHYFTSSLTVKN